MSEADKIDSRFEVEVTKEVKLNPNYNVAPTQIMPVITSTDDGKRNLELMKWGIPRVLGKDLVKELINTRADKAFGGFWRKTVCNRRCLIPASGFYEWKGSKGNKHLFTFILRTKSYLLSQVSGVPGRMMMVMR